MKKKDLEILIKKIEERKEIIKNNSTSKILISGKLSQEELRFEESVLASMIDSPEMICNLIDFVHEGFFIEMKNQKIMSAIIEIYGFNGNPNIEKIMSVMNKSGEFEKIGEQFFLDYLSKKLKVDHYIRTGFENLDYYIRGFQKGELVVIGASQAMGKRPFTLSMISQISCDKNQKIRYFSLDMKAKEIVEILLMIHTEKSRTAINEVHSDDKKNLQFLKRAEELQAKNLIIDEEVFPDYIDLIERIRHDQLFEKSSIFVIDYIQLLGECKSSKKEMNLCLKAFKNLAVELDCVIIILSRISKSIEKSKTRKPQLSYLNELGKFEEYADFIGLLHRPEYFGQLEEKGQSMAGIMFMYIKKSRGKNLNCKIQFEFMKECYKVKDFGPHPGSIINYKHFGSNNNRIL